MSKRYIIHAPSPLDTSPGYAWAWMGGLWLMIMLPLGLYDRDDWGGWPGVVGVTALLMSPFWVQYVWAHSRTVVEIQIASDGEVVFVYERRRRAVPAREIRRIHGIRSKDDNGRIWWRIKIYVGRRRVIRVDYFRAAPEFIEHLRTVNPLLDVTGAWPSYAPRREQSP